MPGTGFCVGMSVKLTRLWGTFSRGVRLRDIVNFRGLKRRQAPGVQSKVKIDDFVLSGPLFLPY